MDAKFTEFLNSCLAARMKDVYRLLEEAPELAEKVPAMIELQRVALVDLLSKEVKPGGDANLYHTSLLFTHDLKNLRYVEDNLRPWRARRAALSVIEQFSIRNTDRLSVIRFSYP